MIPERKIRYWEFFEGVLYFKTPVHIASAEITLETDSALLKTADGRFYIPGTSSAGALRARANDLFEEPELINLIFGYQDKQETGLKSRLFVEDAYAEFPEDAYAEFPVTFLRDGVAVDRKLGASRHKAKYDLEITQADLELPLVIKLEIREEDNAEKMRALILHLMENFKIGRIKLGAGKSRGLGACKFEYRWRSLDFSDPRQISSYLCSRDIKAIPEKEVSVSDLNADLVLKDFKELVCAIEMEVEDSPFLIKNRWSGDDYDAVFTAAMTRNGALDYIPGSSIKGVIRARAEKILRTLGADACDILDIEVGCSSRVKRCLEKLEEENGEKPSEEELARIIHKHSCPICRLFGNACLAGRIQFDDTFFYAEPDKKKLDHVAIDRFTGGALEGKLFNEQPVICGTLRLSFVIRNPSAFDRCLLAFLLRDLRDGLPPIRFGYGKSKGNGVLKFVGATINDQEIKDISAIKNALGVTSADNWWKGEDAHE
ncbi:MAG: hypothetical protein B1H11_04890 [Desulfobacteraceae bacterium 4484_190.1]|nr:MAG: hypothetical protein B1H11_04890 [Desulfobacteraceae bacterium 4484_190.1]